MALLMFLSLARYWIVIYQLALTTSFWDRSCVLWRNYFFYLYRIFAPLICTYSFRFSTYHFYTIFPHFMQFTLNFIYSCFMSLDGTVSYFCVEVNLFPTSFSCLVYSLSIWQFFCLVLSSRFNFCRLICWYFFTKFVFVFLTNFPLLHRRIKDKLN